MENTKDTKDIKEKKKKEKKVSYKKLHKYDHIDNNYLTVDKNAEFAMALCGISTGISCLFFGVLPYGVILYMISKRPPNTSDSPHSFLSYAVWLSLEALQHRSLQR